MEISFDPKRFSGSLPLFPLPQTVLLPGGLLPLHVFEERYRDMVRDALAGERLIGMACVLPGQTDLSGDPEIEPMVCVGKIAVDQELEDGRFNMVLAGLQRARVLSEDRSRSYRLAAVHLVGGVEPEALTPIVAGRRLLAFVEQLPASFVQQSERLAQVVPILRDQVGRELPLGPAVDLVADALALTPEERLEVLRHGHVGRRMGALCTALRRRAQVLTGREPHVDWHPPFSQN